MMATMIGNFQGGGIAGKVQFGSGWWFNDQKDGMQRQMEQLSQSLVYSASLSECRLTLAASYRTHAVTNTSDEFM